MDNLKIQYKLFLAAISLISISPIIFAAIYVMQAPDAITSIPIIQEITEAYNINPNECLKCQDNGLLFGVIFIACITAIILLSFFSALFVIVLLLKPIIGWSFLAAYLILLKGKYPQEWRT